MRILYIITQADGGGAQNYTLALAKHFNGTIAAGVESDKLFSDAKNLQLTTYPLQHLKRNLNPWHDFLALYEIRELIKQLQPDIVHLNSSKAGVLGSFAAIGLKAKAAPSIGQQSWTGTRVVFTAHGFIFNEPMPLWKKNFYLAVEKIASDYRDFIITVSDADKKSALDNKLITEEKITTIHNGLPKLNFLAKDEARDQLKIPQNVLVCGNTSNFYKTKGQDVFIQAVTQLPKEILDKVLFVIFGNGPEFSKLKPLILNLKLTNSFRLLGQTKNAFQYLKALDVFILPSRKEGFPYSILEAMQAGLPIITTAVGGVPEALGTSGMLIKPEDPKALAGAITYLIANEQKRKELSELALQRSKLFSETRMLEETKAIYQQLLQSK